MIQLKDHLAVQYSALMCPRLRREHATWMYLLMPRLTQPLGHIIVYDGAAADSAATPAAAQQRRPNTAARTGPRTAARRRANLRTPGGAVGTPGGASPFLREGSPMDWSPSFPEPAAPKAAGARVSHMHMQSMETGAPCTMS